MSNVNVTHTSNDFKEAMQVCVAVHGEDQPFTIKLLQRDSKSGTIINVLIAHGTLAKHRDQFSAWRDAGWEAYMLLGLTDGQGFAADNVEKTWAVAVDLDDGVVLNKWTASPVKPTFAIKTSDGRYHFCWVLTAPITPSEANKYLSALAYRLNADACFANVTQAVRLPGFINHKYGTPVNLALNIMEWRSYSEKEVSLAMDVELVTAFLRSRQPKFDPSLLLNPKLYEQDLLMKDLADALSYIKADDYGVWIKVGMALHSIGETAFALWDKWSSSSSKYELEATQKKWRSFEVSHMSKVSVKTIFFLAMRNGWSNPGYRHEGKRCTADALNERMLGRLIAQKMQTNFAAVRNGAHDKESFRLLEWDGQKYAGLDNVAKRACIENHFKQLLNEIGDE